MKKIKVHPPTRWNIHGKEVRTRDAQGNQGPLILTQAEFYQKYLYNDKRFSGFNNLKALSQFREEVQSNKPFWNISDRLHELAQQILLDPKPAVDPGLPPEVLLDTMVYQEALFFAETIEEEE